MPTILRRAVLALLVILPAAMPALPAAAEPNDAAGFVQQLVGQALAVLATKGMPEGERERKFAVILTQNFDVLRIARFVLGRYWAGANDDERKQFIEAYRNYIIRSYSARFAEYSGESVKVTNARPESDTISVVNSDIIHPNGDPPVKVAWRVYKGADGYRIVDVDVEGVSMMVTQREEFAAVIQRNGGTVDGLTKALQQKTGAS